MLLSNLQIFWQTIPCNIDEIAFMIGYFQIRWYSISYLLVILTIFLLLWWRIKKNEFAKDETLNKKLSQDLIDIGIFTFIGIVLGARIGYAIFYDPTLLSSNISQLFNPFENGQLIGIYGLSFHGGLIGAVLASFLTIKFKKYYFLPIANFVIPTFPLGYFWGRMGNFFNKELVGKITTSPIGMNFSENCQSKIINHPSQLYEALGEGLLIFIIIWPLRNHSFFKKYLFAIFLILYGIIRFIIEFFRQPEIVIGWLTMGQILCFAMGIIGVLMIYASSKKQEV